MTHLERDGDVFVLMLGDNENRFNPLMIAAVGKLLDEVEAAPAPRALVTTATGKFWSNGLDLDWMRAHVDETPAFMNGVRALFARVLALPLPTVAAISGHAFGAGAVLALAHDFRVMRLDRGFFCLPEVDVPIVFTPGVAAVVQARLSPQVAHEAMTTGRRYGGPDALADALVDATAAPGELVAAAAARVRPLAGKDGPTLGAIKSVMYAPVLAVLAEPRG